MQELAAGLWRWTTPHPLWRPEADVPGGWGQDVASVAFASEGRVVLIDPLVAGDWSDLDEVIGERPVTVVLAAAWHERSSGEVVERYGAGVLVHERGLPRMRCPAQAMRVGEVAPGVEALPVQGVDEGEVVLWLPRPRALISAEVLTGTRDGLRVAESPAVRSRDELWAWVATLAELPVEMILPSHGAPVLRGGREELLAALDRPVW